MILSVLNDLSLTLTQIKAIDDRSANPSILEKRPSPLKTSLKVKVIEFKVHLQGVSSLAKLALLDQLVLIYLLFESISNSRAVN